VTSIRLTALLAGLLFAAPLAAEAQSPQKVARLGYLSSSSSERERSLFAAFRQGLQELGYSDGKNIVIAQRYAGGRFEKLPEMAAELVRLNVDILVVTGAPAAQAAKNATTVVPIVMTNHADPVGTAIVASLARPGGNITGLSDFNAAVVAKRLELLKEAVPSASRVAVLSNPANPTNPLQLKLTQDAARALGVTLLSLEARTADEIERAFSVIRRERPGALLIIGDPALGVYRRQIVDLSLKGQLPTMFSSRIAANDGALMSYGTSFEDLHRRAASYVDKILKGAKPSDLPIEQPTKLEMVVNMKTARALGLTIPPSLLLRADQVIE
jgi:putative ABC transport system substrate-binding protein